MLEDTLGDEADDVRLYRLCRPDMGLEIKRRPTGASDRVAIGTERVGHDVQAVFGCRLVDWPVLAAAHWLLGSSRELDLYESLVPGDTLDLGHRRRRVLVRDSD